MIRYMRWITATALVMLLGLALTVQAGERSISINGDGNAVWFITGENTLVMNGFDLAAFGVAQPAFIDRVSIAVDSAVAGAPVEVVVYEDANGGSPVDARLAGRTTVTINQAGVFTAVFPTPVTVSQRAVWIGFYLPVNFRFLADTAGTSVLTYWAWTPGAAFDLNNLASASVLGPADGSAPVSINMNGKARISFEVSASAAGAASTPGAAGTPALTVQQQPGPAGGDLSVMLPFVNCPLVSYDTADEAISWREDLNTHCSIVANFNASPSPLGYDRRGTLYDIVYFRSGGVVVIGRLDYAVTHCIRPDAADLPTAVLGVAWGAPRVWRIQPTVRIGDLVCADLRRGGNLSVFVPNGQPTATPTGW
jgi:hypothetical protein